MYSHIIKLRHNHFIFKKIHYNIKYVDANFCTMFIVYMSYLLDTVNKILKVINVLKDVRKDFERNLPTSSRRVTSTDF